MSSDMLIVARGQECLDYIDKPIGLAGHDYNTNIENLVTNNQIDWRIHGTDQYTHKLTSLQRVRTRLSKIPHNPSKRCVGLVTNRYEDGGLYVTILGNEVLDKNSVSNYFTQFNFGTNILYEQSAFENEYKRSDEYVAAAQYGTEYEYSSNGAWTWVGTDAPRVEVESFDDAIDFNSTYSEGKFSVLGWRSIENITEGGDWTLSNDKNNTIKFGKGLSATLYYANEMRENPLKFLCGNLYFAGQRFCNLMLGLAMPTFNNITDLVEYDVHVGGMIDSFNCTCLPYNLILTENEHEAYNYLNNGTLPFDAWLYPLDWENLPRYDDPIPEDDKPDDIPNDNTPDDDSRDFDPTPLETPTFTVNRLTNYNWYWLTVPEWSSFINWFWNDIGDFSDFDDIIAKVKGLYNDLASAVIMCRYYPVDVSWIGGTGTQSNIKIGMIEKSGTVDTLANTSLRAQDIGHVHISEKYKSFMDMSPYSQLSLYLPFHGFIDLDMNLFNGHDLYVKALYDYMSGTIQYYIFYDNSVLVNTILCKMAMDIPVTLQTKNDRDSAIFNNVSSTIGGLVGAGLGIASGNPIGMVMGVTQGVSSFNGSNASAPMRLMGNVGESGAYIGCQNCFIVVRRPTIQPSNGNNESSVGKNLNTWKKNVGQLCGYGYKLSNLNNKGFTVCQSPRINFTSTTPLQTEVDEIYDYLSKGVIL